MIDSTYVRSLLGAQTFFNCVLLLILCAIIGTLTFIIVYFKKKKSDILDNIEKITNKNCSSKQATDQTINTLKEVIKIENEKSLKMMDYMSKSLASNKLKDNANVFCQNAANLNENKKQSVSNLFSFKNIHTENNLNRKDSELNPIVKFEQLKEKNKPKRSFIHKMFKKHDADNIIEEDTNLKLQAKPLSSRNLAELKESVDRNMKEKNENTIEIRDHIENMPSISDIHLENLELVDSYEENVNPKMACFTGCFKARAKSSKHNSKSIENLELNRPSSTCPIDFGIPEQNVANQANIYELNLNQSKESFKSLPYDVESKTSASSTSDDTTAFKDSIPNFKSSLHGTDAFSKINLSSSSSRSSNSSRLSTKNRKKKFLSIFKVTKRPNDKKIASAENSNISLHSPFCNMSKSNFSYESNWTAESNRSNNLERHNVNKLNASNGVQASTSKTSLAVSRFFELKAITKQDSNFSGVSSILNYKPFEFSESARTNSSHSKDGYLLPEATRLREMTSETTFASSATNHTTTTASATTCACSTSNISEDSNMEMMPTYSKMLKTNNKYQSELLNVSSRCSSSSSSADTVVEKFPVKLKPSDYSRKLKPESAISVATITNSSIISSENSNTEIESDESNEKNLDTKNNEKTILVKIKGTLQFD